MTPDERDREQERLLREWLARSLSERECRRAALREREKFSLTHRGDYRIAEMGAHPQPFPPAAPTTERFGDWGYRVLEPPSPEPPSVQPAGCYRLMRLAWTRGVCEPICLFRARSKFEIDRFLDRRVALGRPVLRVWIERASHPAARRRPRKIA